MNVARTIFGIIFLLGALANILLASINGVESYHAFADETFFPWYLDAWKTIVVTYMLLFIVLTVAYEITTGLLFIINRKYMKIALIMGIIFCLGTTPVMIQAIYTNVPLALIQGFLLWKEFRRGVAVQSA
ncbi:MAG TPA: hypothetical protein G4N93_01425 [Dehalococcoidia bacterium]|nr:hypothetical protein [Dehalococcoidia bacterium]